MKLLLKIGDNGEPIVKKAMPNARGVIMLPFINEFFSEDSSQSGGGDSDDSVYEYNLTLFIQAGSKITNKGTLVLHTNYDKTSIEYDISNSKSNSITDQYVSIVLHKPGPYYYYIKYSSLDDKKKNAELKQTDSHYFIVPPKLPFNIKLDSISLQTVVSKWIPPKFNGKILTGNIEGEVDVIASWDPILQNIANKGYNMIHFTPLQQRGSSNSPYSIYDQLNYDSLQFPGGEKDVSQLMKHLHSKYHILSLTDIVLNHTAHNSYWLREHPESGYNQYTAPHLKPAIDLEISLLEFSKKIANGEIMSLPTEINTMDDLSTIMNYFDSKILKQDLKLWEYYIVDSDEIISEFKKTLVSDNNNNNKTEKYCAIEEKKITINNFLDLHEVAKKCVEQCSNNGESFYDVSDERFGNKLDVAKFVRFVKEYSHGEHCNDDANSELISIVEFALNIINEINLIQYKYYDDDINTIKNQLKNRTSYLRLDSNGPRLGKITKESPLFENYFTPVEHVDKSKGVFYLANNGWIWNGNPLLDFASDESKAYLRREVIVWEDCVKLRYGKQPSDSPYLWGRMDEYITKNATLFDGFRIDNCHSTPLHIGEHFLSVARFTNPNLYVLAELFSGSEHLDCVFVERLGINALLREAMQAHTVKELSTLIHKYAGNPIGTFKNLNFDDYTLEYYDYELLSSSIPPALIMDCTHDNQTPYQKRTVEDTLSNAALISLSCSAIGSVYGYDEMYPYLLDVVSEKRTYSIVENDGISQIKKLLYEIRADISKDINDYEMFIHHENNYITFHKVNIRTGQGWYLIAKTKFSNDDNDTSNVAFNLASTYDCTLKFAYSLIKTGDPTDTKETITGVPTKIVEIAKNKFSVSVSSENNCEIVVPGTSFPSGSIAVFETHQQPAGSLLATDLVEQCLASMKDLDLTALNALLYRCEPEERDFSEGKQGTYSIPNFGSLKYAGFQGWVSILKNITFNNEVDHPYCDNLRQGTWALDYVESRLDSYIDHFPALVKFQKWIRDIFAKIKLLPAGLRPAYFSILISLCYKCCAHRSIELMKLDDVTVPFFEKQLALVSVQMCSLMKNASLIPAKPITSMAAGLPHFSSSVMRCWGRDIFIALRGLLLTTDRYDDAKLHILSCAKTLKHGLIPNLLDSGINPRYNARDSVWYFLQAIKDYVSIVPNGEQILKEKVKRRFPLDDEYLPLDDPRVFSYESSIEDIIYEIFAKHAKGIEYREANAGPNLDRVMKSEGFDVKVAVDWETGLVHGGSAFNCGTWMDKMGESEKAGSVGVPGTPRDGADIEIIGMLKSSLNFVNALIANKKFKYDKVTKPDESTISFLKWEKLLSDNFEKKFYIPLDPKDDVKYDIDSSIVNRRGIYKDVFGSSKPYEDYQLRPNLMVAMSVAPELFPLDHALICIDKVASILQGPLGMKTLDPSDYNYKPYYINSEDSNDFATSKGRNYHQGPEWVWCFGYYLRAYYHFKKQALSVASSSDGEKLLKLDIWSKLQPHKDWISNSEWAGLTELTNKDGSICDDSSPTQAWSAGCLLDVLYDMSL